MPAESTLCPAKRWASMDAHLAGLLRSVSAKPLLPAGLRTSAGRATGSDAPEATGSGAPEAPGSDAPEAPGSDALEAPGWDAPEAPGSSAPEAPGSDAPEAPGSDALEADSDGRAALPGARVAGAAARAAGA